ncbi:hypothetical protein GCM10010471_04760 [Leucobacter komagatae]
MARPEWLDEPLETAWVLIMTTTVLPTLTGLGPLKYTRARAEDFPPIAKAYTRLSQTARESGLFARTPWFYWLVAAGIAVGLAATTAGSILLGDSWFQLLMAAAYALLFTQIAFLTHEAARRQLLTTGPANDRQARVLAASIGMSYAWRDSKHTRHHANPNRVGKDPDIEIDTISFIEEDAVKARGLLRFITQRQGVAVLPALDA